MFSWYVLNSTPHSKKIADEFLLACGIETYFPMWQPAKRGGRISVPRPLLPGYLFAYVDLKIVGLCALIYVSGLRRLVFCDGEARVRDTELQALRHRLDALKNLFREATGQPLSHGDRIEITADPSQGSDAIFDGCLSHGARVHLLIRFLEKNMRCEMNSEFARKRNFGKFYQRRFIQTL